jgi:cell division protein FtsL
MGEKKISSQALILLGLIVFILLFSYLSLNLKSIDYGYKMQELTDKKNTLKEEINKLKAEKASLLNLERVENIVKNKLGYQYPEPDQLIKVYEE